MSRWRAPREKSSPYITPEGYKALELELKELWQKRAEVCKALAAAAAEGDRSENAEYIYRKKELRGIDSRIGYLQRRMPNLKIVSNVSDTSLVFFGAWVSLEDDSGEEVSYRIVGSDELDNGLNHISIDSPLARVLLGKACDDEVSLNIGPKQQHYYILAIHYDHSGERPQSNS
jgi:transcription elongation factor GreB